MRVFRFIKQCRLRVANLERVLFFPRVSRWMMDGNWDRYRVEPRSKREFTSEIDANGQIDIIREVNTPLCRAALEKLRFSQKKKSSSLKSSRDADSPTTKF